MGIESEKLKGTAQSAGTSAAIGAAKGGIGAAIGGEGVLSGIGAGASSAVQSLVPIGILISTYLGYRGYRDSKKAFGTSLKSEEVEGFADPTGATGTINKTLGGVKELPKELGVIAQPFLLGPQKLIGKLFGSGKHDDQIDRDRWRVNLERLGIAHKVDGSHHLKRADGLVYDIGVDGHNKVLSRLGNEVRPYNLDETDPLTGQTIGFLNPLASMLSGGDEKLTSDGVGILGNFVSQGTQSIEEIQANTKQLYEDVFGQQAAQQGISTQELALGSLQSMYDMGKIDEGHFIAYSNGIRQIFGTAPLTPPGTPIEQDPTTPMGIVAADPAQGFVNNTATAGVALDDGIDTLGRPTPDFLPPAGDLNSLVPIASVDAFKPPQAGKEITAKVQQAGQGQPETQVQQQQLQTTYLDLLKNPNIKAAPGSGILGNPVLQQKFAGILGVPTSGTAR